MITTRTLLAAAVASACTLTQVSAQEPVMHFIRGVADGHAFQTGSKAMAVPADLERGQMPYDLQLTLSEGRHNADATGVKLTITGPTGQKVFALEDAGALTDVDLPTGHYHVVADFGRVKRMGGVDVEKGALATLYLHAPNEPS